MPDTAKDNAPAQSQVAGIDVGGTFTDLVLFDATHGTVRLAKVPTTLPNQSFGVLNALDAAEADISALDLIVHGTTTTTNAVLERHLCKTGLITTMSIDCIAAMPWGAGRRPSARMTKFEKAKKAPAIRPAPSAAMKAKWQTKF